MNEGKETFKLFKLLPLKQLWSKDKSLFFSIHQRVGFSRLPDVCNHSGFNDGSSDVSKSWAVLFCFFLICLTSQRSGRPPDLWHSTRSAEHIRMIRKEKPGTAGTHGTACHTATAGLRTSLTHAVAPSLLFQLHLPACFGL